MKNYIAFILVILISSSLFSQSEYDLKKALEGKRVEVLIEMPATSKGINLYMNESSIMDFEDYSYRIKQYGIALYPGDKVLITKVKQKKRHIEFQLAGGGYGTLTDESAVVFAGSVPKKSRQKELEKLLDSDKNIPNRKKLENELDDLKRERRIEKDKAQRDADREQGSRETRIQDKRFQSGSRFNIRYEHVVGSKELNINSIYKALEKYINFNLNKPDLTNQNQSSTPALSSPTSLQKGITLDDAIKIMGVPNNLNTANECGFTKTTCDFEHNNQHIKGVFVEKILIKYTVSSK